MKKSIVPFLTFLIFALFGCKGQYQNVDSFERTSTSCINNGDKILAFSNNTTKYLNSYKTEYKDSLIDEIYIKFHFIEPILYDTIKTEAIRRVINDSILFSGEVPVRIVNKLNLDTMNISADRKCFTLIYILKNGEEKYKYQYDIQLEKLIKISSEFKFIGKD